MEEPEVPLEHVQEETLHHAKHAKDEWTLWVALSSAIFAVVAAIAALRSGYHANEAVIEQIHASDHWSYYQAKSIKFNILMVKNELLAAANHPPSETDNAKLETYKKDMEEISNEARENEATSSRHLQSHVIYAKSVTFMQVAIATAAIAVMTKRRRFWMVGLLLGLVGTVFLVQAALFFL